MIPITTDSDTSPLVEIRPSSFKHGFTARDVHAVFSTYFYNRPLKNRAGIELMLGFSETGVLLELFFEKVDGRYVVFHVMKCRKQFIDAYARDRSY